MQTPQGIQILQSVAGTIYLLTMTVVAIRLLVLARRNRALPELVLGLSLLVGGTFGASLEAAGLASGVTGTEPKVTGALLLSGKLFGLVGMTCQGVFVWRVFRPDAAWAPAIVAICFTLAAAAFVGFWAHGTFATGEVPLTWFWPELAARTTGSVWLVAEAVHYYGAMRRRMRLGLADPVVSNRFLLWGAAGACGVVLMATSVPPAVAPESTHPLMAWDLLLFSLAGFGFSIAYWLAFFPPARYRRWIETRATSAAGVGV